MDVGVKIYLSLDDGMQFVYLSQAGKWSMPIRSFEKVEVGKGHSIESRYK